MQFNARHVVSFFSIAEQKIAGLQLCIFTIRCLLGGGCVHISAEFKYIVQQDLSFLHISQRVMPMTPTICRARAHTHTQSPRNAQFLLAPGQAFFHFHYMWCDKHSAPDILLKTIENVRKAVVHV